MSSQKIEYQIFAPTQSSGLLTSDNKVFQVKKIITYNYDFYLYKNSAEVNRVNKSNFLFNVKNVIGVFREECSVTSPSVLLEISPTIDFNYIYIPAFNRWYFVNDKKVINNKVCRVELTCDVLMSYNKQIVTLQGVIGRQENDFNPLLIDNELPTQNNPIVEVINIPSDAFNTQTSDEKHNFLLTVIGA